VDQIVEVRPRMKILVRRWGALGDVILTTPIVRRLRRTHPQAEIVVETAYPEVYRNNPHATIATSAQCDRCIVLDRAYEWRPSMHIVEAYMLEAFGDTGEPRDRQQELFPPPNVNILKSKRCVAVHAAQAGWKNRTLPSATWVAVCEGLKRVGLWPILVGSERDALPEAQATCFHVPDLLTQTSLIANCRCFVGSDTSLLHAAGATATPIVGIFTSVWPKFRLPWRDGVLGANCRVVMPNLTCLGCQERAPVPNIVEVCERGDIACVERVTAADIVHAVVELTS